MADIPRCPNNRQSTTICERSELRLVGENDNSFLFTCSTCSLLWAVSKDKTKERGQWEANIRKVQQASEIEQDRARKRAYSFAR